VGFRQPDVAEGELRTLARYRAELGNGFCSILVDQGNVPLGEMGVHILGAFFDDLVHVPCRLFDLLAGQMDLGQGILRLKKLTVPRIVLQRKAFIEKLQ